MPDGDSSNGPRVPVGLMVAGSEMVSFTLLGLLLDYALATMPWFTIAMTLLGLFAAFHQVTRMARKLAERHENAARPPDRDNREGNGGSGS